MSGMAEEGKRLACEAISGREGELRRIGEEIWNHPELRFEEHTAHRLLTRFLSKEGFKVERGYKDLSTAILRAL